MPASMPHREIFAPNGARAFQFQRECQRMPQVQLRRGVSSKRDIGKRLRERPSDIARANPAADVDSAMHAMQRAVFDHVRLFAPADAPFPQLLRSPYASALGIRTLGVCALGIYALGIHTPDAIARTLPQSRPTCGCCG